jgi:hypothetical protein
MNTKEINQMMRKNADGSMEETLLEKVIISVAFIAFIVVLVMMPDLTTWR